MFKYIAGTEIVGPAQKSRVQILEIDYSRCDVLGYLDAVNKMYQIELKVPKPTPLSEKEDDPTFQAFQYLKSIEKIIKQSAIFKLSEVTIVESLNKIFEREFEDIESITPSATVKAYINDK